MTELLNAAAIWKRFGSVDVLQGVDLSARAGECLVLLGPSGSGKSTLLRCLNLLEPVSSGSILFEGREIARTPRGQAASVRRRMGMVFQNFELFAHLSALENIALAPIRVRGLPPAEARAQAQALLDRVHLPDKADAYPDELSGGQQQRVAIARALAMDPVLMLFDEPTSALDPETVGEVLGVMQELTEGGMTSIVVTHELGFAQRAADEVIFMDAGRIAHRAPVDEFFADAVPERVERFLSRMKGLE
jgi:polar amino acid transport system ATP-binding protein